ncbi:hypothetical protein FRB96_001753 [Tulasnella sp. 330]|nr:hypothetical protein FRB96_001753 [Tulasnella sp. 330]KAG8881509.1 hypothetical protein FRB97_009436 [Tulasnella sp. 331]KAG8885845.1 hypothetical protein FRB98_001591 [Tulasnella sp. 332]
MRLSIIKASVAIVILQLAASTFAVPIPVPPIAKTPGVEAKDIASLENLASSGDHVLAQAVRNNDAHLLALQGSAMKIVMHYRKNALRAEHLNDAVYVQSDRLLNAYTRDLRAPGRKEPSTFQWDMMRYDVRQEDKENSAYRARLSNPRNSNIQPPHAGA